MQTFSIDEAAIDVRLGDQFCIEAPAVPTAGYRWSVDDLGNALAEIESGPKYQRREAAVGGSAIQRIVLEAREAGVVTVRLTYAQAAATAPEKTRQIEVLVTD